MKITTQYVNTSRRGVTKWKLTQNRRHLGADTTVFAGPGGVAEVHRCGARLCPACGMFGDHIHRAVNYAAFGVDPGRSR